MRGRGVWLTNGEIALVDTEDFKRVSRIRWSHHTKGYAFATINGKSVMLHNFILRRPASRFIVVDHKNRDRLDNRKANLEVKTQAENVRNRPIDRRNKSGCLGVTWHAAANKWAARLFIKGKAMWLGVFDEVKDACAARIAAEVEILSTNLRS